MLLHQHARQRDDVARLGAKQADRADQLGDARFAERQHHLRRVGQGEQRRGRLVDPDIGRLRRQHDRDQQGERVDEFELGLRDRPGGLQPAIEFRDLAFREATHRRRV